MTKFKELIVELSQRLQCDLFADLNNIVTLIVEKKVKFHIQADSVEEFMTLGAVICELPPGKFREHILKDSLKANFTVHLNPGILSYAQKENVLILHTKLLIESSSVDEIVKVMQHLTKKAKKWMEAIDSGRASPDDELPKKTIVGNNKMFGF